MAALALVDRFRLARSRQTLVAVSRSLRLVRRALADLRVQRQQSCAGVVERRQGLAAFQAVEVAARYAGFAGDLCDRQAARLADFADQRGGIELRRSDGMRGTPSGDRVRRLLNLGRLRSALALFIAGDYRDPPGGLGRPHRRVSPAGCQGAAGPENRATREAGGAARAMAKAPHRWGACSSTPVRLDHWRR